MPPEQDPGQFVDMVAQAVLDRLEERQRVNSLADLVLARVMQLQAEEAAAAQSSSSEPTTSPAHQPPGEDRHHVAE